MYAEIQVAKQKYIILKNEVKFQLYTVALEQISFFNNLLATLPTNQQLSKPSRENLKQQYNKVALNDNHLSKINAHQEHTKNSKISKWPAKPYAPHIIQTTGVTARNALSSALPIISNFSKDVSDQQQVPRAKFQHLCLANDANIDARIIGDSITNQVNGNQVGSRLVARGFGGYTTSMYAAGPHK